MFLVYEGQVTLETIPPKLQNPVGKSLTVSWVGTPIFWCYANVLNAVLDIKEMQNRTSEI